MKYDFELQKVIEEISQSKAKHVAIQLADGLKIYAKEIQDAIEEQTEAKVFIWLNSCYGACDVPDFSRITPSVDLVVQFGHEKFIKTF